MQKVISEVYNVVFGVRKQFAQCEKQISDCESVAPGIPRIFFWKPLGPEFFSWNESRNFFPMSSCPPPSPKSQMIDSYMCFNAT